MLRLTAGQFKGRSIHAPRTDETRPTQAKLRQALFNSLQVHIPEAAVLDLFAGSGALGFEALSRGARRVVFVESSRQACRIIERNAAELGVEGLVRIVGEPLEHAWGLLENEGQFDIVLADPPYEADWEKRLLEHSPWTGLLAPGGFLCLEWGIQKSQRFGKGGAESVLPEKTPFLVKVREKNYGDSMLTTYRRENE